MNASRYIGIVSEFSNGASYQESAAKHGVSKTTAANVIYRFCLEKRLIEKNIYCRLWMNFKHMRKCESVKDGDSFEFSKTPAKLRNEIKLALKGK